jgi:hypothetical protein
VVKYTKFCQHQSYSSLRLPDVARQSATSAPAQVKLGSAFILNRSLTKSLVKLNRENEFAMIPDPRFNSTRLILMIDLLRMNCTSRLYSTAVAQVAPDTLTRTEKKLIISLRSVVLHLDLTQICTSDTSNKT